MSTTPHDLISALNGADMLEIDRASAGRMIDRM